MGHIPDDATHWDSGDWIDYHRSAAGVAETSTTEAAEDPLARLTAMHVNMLRAAKCYYEMTGQHLPIYPAIAHVYAAIHYDLPLEPSPRDCTATGVEILHITPHGPKNIVKVDLSRSFKALIVVRIRDNFTTDARMIERSSLPDSCDGLYDLSWPALSRRDAP